MNDIFIIAGPTASGKSELAMLLAQKFNGVIINADSMQIYKEIPIITASPSISEKQQIDHYLYNYVSIFHSDINELNSFDNISQSKVNADYNNINLQQSITKHLTDRRYSVAKYVQEACKIIRSVIHALKLPIVVGGSGMYINALVYGIHHIPEITLEIRMQVQDLYKKLTKQEFYQKLIDLDPISKNYIHSSDAQRMIRAYEVVLQTNKSIFSYHNSKLVSPLEGYNVKKIILLPDRQLLYQNCNQRFAKLATNGELVDEIIKIKPYYDHISISAKKALGINEIISYLNQELTIEEAITIAQQKIRQYAKRQLTWFRNQTINGYTLHYQSMSELYKTQVNDVFFN
ncbi:tRNA delta(2)-isopentenylpyrophosphate transferase [Orientia tsutsugamushi str. Ikeda]|uniref:tRNA dimethylallyltransferase n=1 Tax=Orientia tsutsugamushi (strain Ikeda) TaxID=334380 RepID=MIAA_ORITI|nr:tRNA (adenosine(37)-N6)-dimethylallyltransferase MiaA [Orientia tsutsugamushi]B3CUN6.1 RecName: Full=tRNA dimethylallyltransferase; AltName: Full=Dimethylallyl diphosphate:tRNA dimethylallyltransferase; Short=DMAPP:tRNA dimethylallyltransferase; Short=DMATase; AltName: Full=Isopentenyl-diphosphate:tRNA isopentenyltransferase; Short=IPP transferase; Short=IPPT; Short=IPTase [Orientia tsutsugamushi str. Ikeda]BAG41083.1 tRNA delta(2)-isopentenylpyrophosphate transferase [Orientia tsutsugamushi s